MKISRDNMQDKIDSKHHTQDNITKKDGLTLRLTQESVVNVGGSAAMVKVVIFLQVLQR